MGYTFGKIIDNNGKFSVFVDKAGEYYVHIYLDGYVNTPVKLEEGKDINGITLKKVAIVSSITKVDGTVDPAPWYDVPVYEKVNGSLCFDVKDDFAQVEGMFIRPELVTDKVQITYTLERRAKPETSSATEDGDASMGMQIYGTKASYGARLIGTGYRIMVNDGYNVATNIEKREGSPIDMKLINMPEPYNFKFIKDGRYLEMYAKLQSQSQYTLVYTLDTMGSHHSVGSEKADLAISWCYWGFADVTISDIVVTDLSK